MLDIPSVLRRRSTAILLLAILATSCGRLPTAAQLSARPAATPASHGGGATGSGDPLAGQVVVTLAPGADAGALANDVGATLVGNVSDCREATFVPAAGQTAVELQTSLAADPRVVTSEPDGWLETAETRQQSFAFDDGLGSLTTPIEPPAAQAIRSEERRVGKEGRC